MPSRAQTRRASRYLTLLLGVSLATTAVANPTEASTTTETLAEQPENPAATEQESDGSRTNVLTLEDALELAVERTPTLQIARSETEQALLQRFAVRMERAPQITLTLGAGPGPRGVDRRQSDGSISEELIYIGGVSLGGEARIVVPISTFGKIKLASQLADMGIRAAELAEDVAKLEARYEAFRAYTGLQWYRSM